MTFLKVQYYQREKASSMGARWNAAKKAWFAPDTLNKAKRDALITTFGIMTEEDFAKRQNNANNAKNNSQQNIKKAVNGQHNDNMPASNSHNKDNATAVISRNNDNIAVMKSQHNDNLQNTSAPVNVAPADQNKQHNDKNYSHNNENKPMIASHNDESKSAITSHNNDNDGTISSHNNDNKRDTAGQNYDNKRVTNEQNVDCIALNNRQHNDNIDCIDNCLQAQSDVSAVQNNNDNKNNDNSASTANTAGSFNWDNVINKSNLLYIISAVKQYGLPDDVNLRSKLFIRLKNRKKDDYPVTYDGLKTYYPKLNDYYPEDMLADYVRKFSAGGNYKYNIANDKELAKDIKSLLLFILP